MHEPARHLVGGELRARVLGELVEQGRRARSRLHDRGDPFTPPLVGYADDDGVEHVAACDFSAASTSSGYTFSPPVLIETEPRPSTVMVPSSSMRAWSPGTDQRTPSITGNVAAVFSASL